jgi:hypothetical protein
MRFAWHRAEPQRTGCGRSVPFAQRPEVSSVHTRSRLHTHMYTKQPPRAKLHRRPTYVLSLAQNGGDISYLAATQPVLFNSHRSNTRIDQTPPCCLMPRTCTPQSLGVILLSMTRGGVHVAHVQVPHHVPRQHVARGFALVASH